MYAAVRRYRRTGKKQRKEQAAQIEHQLRPDVAGHAGVQAFAVADDGGRFTAVTIVADRGVAQAELERAARATAAPIELRRSRIEELGPDG